MAACSPRVAAACQKELRRAGDQTGKARDHEGRVPLANGKTETWVADRTGHRSSEMVNRYRRTARTWSELKLGALVALDEAIPELRPLP